MTIKRKKGKVDISGCVKKLIREGKPQKQAVAIALSKVRRKKKKKKK